MCNTEGFHFHSELGTLQDVKRINQLSADSADGNYCSLRTVISATSYGVGDNTGNVAWPAFLQRPLLPSRG